MMYQYPLHMYILYALYMQVVDALVRTHSSTTPCPLLINEQTKSPLDIEKEIRGILAENKANLYIKEIKRVHIFYVNAAMYNIEVVVKLNNMLTSSPVHYSSGNTGSHAATLTMADAATIRYVHMSYYTCMYSMYTTLYYILCVID